MISCGKCFIVSGALLLLLAWYMYVPVWEGHSQFSSIGFMLAVSKLTNLLPPIGDALGIDTELNITRKIFTFNTGSVEAAPGLIIEDDIFDGVPVRIYRPDKELADSPEKKVSSTAYRGLVYYHGGGWIMGTPRNFDRYIVKMAQSLRDIVIVSVDYRLAPEYPFPIPFEDCVRATEYLLDKAYSQFNVDPHRIGVAGDSAGGNLVAAVSLKLRARSKTQPRIKIQVLNVPVLQAIDFMTPSYQLNANDPMIGPKQLARCVVLYATGRMNLSLEAAMVINNHSSSSAKIALTKSHLNHDFIPKELRAPNYQKPKLDFGDEGIWNEIKNAVLNPYFSPLLAEDFSGLPPALVVTCQHDVLRDDGIFYVKRLEKAGVSVKHVHVMTGFHALVMFSDSVDEARRTYNTIIEFMNMNL